MPVGSWGAQNMATFKPISDVIVCANVHWRGFDKEHATTLTTLQREPALDSALSLAHGFTSSENAKSA
jgi:hypothetical protein